MNKIYMSFNNYRFKLVIVNIDSKLMSIEDKVFHIDETEANRLLNIIDTLSNDDRGRSLDPVRISITTEKNGEISLFQSNSNRCKGFSELDDWIGEMYGRYIWL